MSEYIDAAKLKNQITDYKKAVHCRNSDYLNGYISAISTVEGMIAETPTADVAEVKHGKWIKDRNCYTCSKCGFYYFANNSRANYCPNCGAKMDKH